MSANRIFSVAPFSDNSFGFLSFVERQKAACEGAPCAVIAAAAEAASLRNDKQTAEVIRSLLPGLSQPHASDLGASPSRKITEIHAATVLHRVYPMDIPHVDGSSSLAASTQRADDPSTWPHVAPDGVLPSFVANFEFFHVSTLAALNEEREVGRLAGGARLPSVRALELHYGPSVRTGSKSTGFSYRSKHVRGGSQRVDNDFSKRKPFYDIMDSEGDAGLLRLTALITEKYGAAAPPCWSQVSWLLSDLKKLKPEYEARKQRASLGAASSSKRHKHEAASGAQANED